MWKCWVTLNPVIALELEEISHFWWFPLPILAISFLISNKLMNICIDIKSLSHLIISLIAQSVRSYCPWIIDNQEKKCPNSIFTNSILVSIRPSGLLNLYGITAKYDNQFVMDNPELLAFDEEKIGKVSINFSLSPFPIIFRTCLLV